MKIAVSLALALVLAAGSFALVAGEKAETTLTGSMMCAHCTLHEKGVTACQDVLVVKGDEKSGEAKYYFEKNKVADDFGHACSGAKEVRVTGTVAEKDGRKWIAATKIENLGKS